MSYNVNLSCLWFSVQSQCGGDKICDLYIEIGGTATAAFHTNGHDIGGQTDSAFLVAQCNAGDTVLIRVGEGGATVYGTYQTMRTAVFAGALLSLT